MNWINGILTIAVAVQPSSHDRACGPRCVAHILKHYGQQHDVIDLVREIQGTALDDGSSLAQLDESLRNHGLYTRSVKLSGDAQLKWQHPVLVHLGPPEDGHWVVWFPGDSFKRGPVVHDGVRFLRMNEVQFVAARSGNCLLTSDKPIEDISKAVVTEGSGGSLLWIALGVLQVALVCMVVLTFRRHMEFNSKGET